MKQTLLNLLKKKGYKSSLQHNTLSFSDHNYSVKLLYSNSVLDMTITLIPNSDDNSSAIVEFKELPTNLNDLRTLFLNMCKTNCPTYKKYLYIQDGLSSLNYSSLLSCLNELSTLIEEYLIELFLKEITF
jgi:hypothetical protein